MRADPGRCYDDLTPDEGAHRGAPRRREERRELVERDRARHRDVERLGFAGQRDRHAHPAELVRRPLPLGPEQEEAGNAPARRPRAARRHVPPEHQAPLRRSSRRRGRTRKIAPAEARSARGPSGSAPRARARRRRTRPPRGAACPRCRDPTPQALTRSGAPRGNRRSEEPDDARRVAERRDLAEELWQDVLARHEELDRLDAAAAASTRSSPRPRRGLSLAVLAREASGRAGLLVRRDSIGNQAA